MHKYIQLTGACPATKAATFSNSYACAVDTSCSCCVCVLVCTGQVMDNVVPAMRRAGPGVQQVFRARFSAVSAPEVHAAMVSRL